MCRGHTHPPCMPALPYSMLNHGTLLSGCKHRAETHTFACRTWTALGPLLPHARLTTSRNCLVQSWRLVGNPPLPCYRTVPVLLIHLQTSHDMSQVWVFKLTMKSECGSEAGFDPRLNPPHPAVMELRRAHKPRLQGSELRLELRAEDKVCAAPACLAHAVPARLGSTQLRRQTTESSHHAPVKGDTDLRPLYGISPHLNSDQPEGMQRQRVQTVLTCESSSAAPLSSAWWWLLLAVPSISAAMRAASCAEMRAFLQQARESVS